jgi:predicted ester cyclase
MTSQAVHLANKRFVHHAMVEIAEAGPNGIAGALARAYHTDAVWRGSHPMNEMTGIAAIEAQVWRGLHHAFPDLERRAAILMAGTYDGHDLVGCTGHLCGTFHKDWLGIPATGKTVYLRFGEFHRMVDGRIAQSTVLIDVLDVIRQAGVWPLTASLGTEGMWPGPFTAEGILLTEQDETLGQANFTQMRAMQQALGQHGDWRVMGRDAFLIPSQVEGWHPKMMWYGPSGIGTARGIEGFVDHHRLPWRRAFHNTVGGQHYARIADGAYTATAGWPSLTTDHLGGGLMGLPPTGRQITMRVMDFYLHHEGLIRENWVPIDIIHMLLQMDVDVFDRIRTLFGSNSVKT